MERAHRERRGNPNPNPNPKPNPNPHPSPNPNPNPNPNPKPIPNPSPNSNQAHVLYGDFMNPESDDYVFIPDMDKLIGAMNTHLEDYNAVSKVRVTAGARDHPEPNPNP